MSAQIRSARRYYLLKRLAARVSGDSALELTWQSKQEGEGGIGLPPDLPSYTTLVAAGYSTVQDLDGADTDELASIGIRNRQADRVFAALASLAAEAIMTTPVGFFDTDGVWRNTVQASVRLPLASFFQLAGPGTPIAAFANGTSTVPGFAIDDSEMPAIRWNNDAAPAAIVTTADIPDDRQPSTPMILHIMASKTGATSGDATTFTIGAFMVATAALRDADADAGGATTAMTGTATSKTVQHVTRTIAAADIPNPTAALPAVLSLTIKPTATLLGTDDVSIHRVWLEYTKITNPG